VASEGANAGVSSPVTTGAATLLQDFLAHLVNERRLSRLTVVSYERDIEALLELAAGTPLGQLQIHHMRRFIAQLHSRGLDGKSLARMLSHGAGSIATWRAITRSRATRVSDCARRNPARICRTRYRPTKPRA
jgi:integrase/recombinase XerC